MVNKKNMAEREESLEQTSDSEIEMETDLGVLERGRRARGIRGRSRGASRGRGRISRGSRSRGGSTSRGRSRGRGRGQVTGEKSDRDRVEERRLEKTAKMRELIQEMDPDGLRNLVLNLVTREPGLVFDLVEGVEDPSNSQSSPPTGRSPSWCRCGHCREMPTELEKKCCGCLPQNCVSERDEFNTLVLDPQVLALGQRYRNDMLGGHRQPIHNYNKTMRHSAYRNFILWRHGRLGAGIRRVIPSCCVWAVRDKFPSPTNQYTGFIPSRYI